MGWKEERIMATSSITANFHCEDAKAANAFVRLRFAPKAAASWKVPDTSDVRIRDDMNAAQKRAFWRKVAERNAKTDA